MSTSKTIGRPKKGAKLVTLNLTSTIAQRIHRELAKKEIASSRYQTILLQAYSEETPWQEQSKMLQEELRLINQMQESELEQVRAKYAVHRDYVNRLQLLLNERVRNKNLADAEREIEQLKNEEKLK